MEYFAVRESAKPMVEKPKTRKPRDKKPKVEKPKARKLRVEKPKVQKPKLVLKEGERLLPFSLFEGITSKERKAFEKLKPTERLALIELERLRRQAKAQREKLTARTEEQKPKPVSLPLEEELQLTRMRIENAIVPRQADIDRIAKLEEKLGLAPAPVPAAQAIQAPPIAPAIQAAPKPVKPVTSFTDYKKTVAYKSLTADQRERLGDIVLQMNMKDKRVFFSDLTAKPPAAQITELKTLLTPMVQVPAFPGKRVLPQLPRVQAQALPPEVPAQAAAVAPAQPAVVAPEEMIIPEGFFDERVPEPGVVGSGLKVSKPVIKRIVKRVVSKFAHPKDVAVILHTIRHPKLRLAMGHRSIEDHAIAVLDRFIKHMKPKFSEKKTLKRDLKKAFIDLERK